MTRDLGKLIDLRFVQDENALAPIVANEVEKFIFSRLEQLLKALLPMDFIVVGKVNVKMELVPAKELGAIESTPSPNTICFGMASPPSGILRLITIESIFDRSAEELILISFVDVANVIVFMLSHDANAELSMLVTLPGITGLLKSIHPLYLLMVDTQYYAAYTVEKWLWRWIRLLKREYLTFLTCINKKSENIIGYLRKK